MTSSEESLAIIAEKKPTSPVDMETLIGMSESDLHELQADKVKGLIEQKDYHNLMFWLDPERYRSMIKAQQDSRILFPDPGAPEVLLPENSEDAILPEFDDGYSRDLLKNLSEGIELTEELLSDLGENEAYVIQGSVDSGYSGVQIKDPYILVLSKEPGTGKREINIHLTKSPCAGMATEKLLGYERSRKPNSPGFIYSKVAYARGPDGSVDIFETLDEMGQRLQVDPQDFFHGMTLNYYRKMKRLTEDPAVLADMAATYLFLEQQALSTWGGEDKRRFIRHRLDEDFISGLKESLEIV